MLLGEQKKKKKRRWQTNSATSASEGSWGCSRYLLTALLRHVGPLGCRTHGVHTSPSGAWTPTSQPSKRNSNRGFSTVKIGLFFTDRHGTHFKLPHSDHVSAGLFSSLLPSAAVSLRVVLPSSSTQFASSTSYPAPGSARQNQVPISSDYRLFSSSITTTSSVNTQPGCFLYFSSSDDCDC